MFKSQKVNAGAYLVTMNDREVARIWSPERNEASHWSADFSGDFYFLVSEYGNFEGKTKRSVLDQVKDFDFASYTERADALR